MQQASKFSCLPSTPELAYYGHFTAATQTSGLPLPLPIRVQQVSSNKHRGKHEDMIRPSLNDAISYASLQFVA
jgi:hypothetical protein